MHCNIAVLLVSLFIVFSCTISELTAFDW